jgi:hypothetical protein
MLGKIEDALLRILQRRRNLRRYGVPTVTVRDCMDLMFVLSGRLDRIEKIILDFRKRIECGIQS